MKIGKTLKEAKCNTGKSLQDRSAANTYKEKQQDLEAEYGCNSSFLQAFYAVLLRKCSNELEWIVTEQEPESKVELAAGSLPTFSFQEFDVLLIPKLH